MNSYKVCKLCQDDPKEISFKHIKNGTKNAAF